jgi:DNA-binding CsgD family transcriptional regulator
VRLVAEDVQRRALFGTLGVRAEADLAEIARARRDDDAAAAAAGRAAAFRAVALEHAGVARHAALAATAEAEQARADGRADPALWDAAARAWDERRAPYQVACARWRAAEAALARRDRAAAAETLRAARAAAVTLGAAGLRAELEALARRARIDLADGGSPEPEPSGDAGAAAELGLTAREREVLARLVLGRTNRQIAGELFISVRTAGVHVSHILTKLGAANRGEAAAIAHRLGLGS